jgi:hypothetical protein
MRAHPTVIDNLKAAIATAVPEVWIRQPVRGALVPSMVCSVYFGGIVPVSDSA